MTTTTTNRDEAGRALATIAEIMRDADWSGVLYDGDALTRIEEVLFTAGHDIESPANPTAPDRDRAGDPRFGDRTACRYCGLDIEYHGLDGDPADPAAWIDRGANTGCTDGHPHHVPVSDLA